MSTSRTPRAKPLRSQARVFAALGDSTRLHIVAQLGGGQRQSIARLTSGSRITRQAITKHLRILRRAGIVRSVRFGRERLFELKAEPIDSARKALDHIARQWEDALQRLKEFVE